ncbi:MAG: hypothetical protein IH933_01640 [Euryarchaeota archaeon]|jgi:hypothetical protein|nr:hypothetical protein [Euryarchaeota archaeon]
MGGDEIAADHRLRGAVDGEALVAIRGVFERQAPFGTASLDDLVDPSLLVVTLNVGLREGATGRFDIQWTVEGDYKFHYTEDDLDFRWGHHPHNGEYDVQGDAHFHPPPEASSSPNEVEPSCFTVHQPKLVARGVLKNWRAAYHSDVRELNSPDNTG